MNSIVFVQIRNKILCQLKFLELQSVAINCPNVDDLFNLKLDNLLDHPVQFLEIIISYS